MPSFPPAAFFSMAALAGAGMAGDDGLFLHHEQLALGIHVEIAMFAVEHGLDFVLGHALFRFLRDVLDLAALERVLHGLLHGGGKIFQLQALAAAADRHRERRAAQIRGMSVSLKSPVRNRSNGT